MEAAPAPRRFTHRRKAWIVLGSVLLMATLITVRYGTNKLSIHLKDIEVGSTIGIDEPLNVTRNVKQPGPKLTNIPHYENAISPACKPHFQVASRPDEKLKWSNSSKFERIYFYHSRKAGGTSFKYYMEMVAKHHGVEFVASEFGASGVPGANSKPTFYITNMRQPVERSISHFKYEGRWNCNQLVTNYKAYNASEANANKLESWVGDIPCSTAKGNYFHLVKCATNCYTQWYSGLSCPAWNISIDIQAERARAILHRFNFILILEKMKDPQYVSAVENFFGVPGLTVKKSAWCEIESHRANKKFPLEVKPETLQRLTDQNQVDIDLYNNISSCQFNGVYDFPAWDGDRFDSDNTLRMHYTDFPQWKIEQNMKKKEKLSQKKGTTKVLRPSPACEPHFDLATSSSGWDNRTKFKRLYFYHSRKAGGSSLRYYLEKVAMHHGLEFAVTEYEMAENPGSYDKETFYVTNLREPVSRSISGFKYEGRWDCNQLVYNSSFVPTEANANKLETWIHSGGHNIMKCKFKHKTKPLLFFLGGCAINCFTQWFAGICPKESVSWQQQYEIAAEKLFRYNFIVVLEKLKDPKYVSAVENFFGVPGITKKKTSLCEPESDRANMLNPLIVQNHTMGKLKKLNTFDIMLYHRLTDCLGNEQYSFPEWNRDRFSSNSSSQIPYERFEQWDKDRNERGKAEKLAKFRAALT